MHCDLGPASALTLIKQLRSSICQTLSGCILIWSGEPPSGEGVLTTSRIGQDEHGSRSRRSTLPRTETRLPCAFVVIHVCQHGAHVGKLSSAGISRDRPGHCRLAESGTLPDESQTVPVVDRQEPALVKTNVARRPICVGDNRRALVLLAHELCSAGNVVDPFGADFGAVEVKERAVWRSIEPITPRAKRVPCQWGDPRDIDAQSDLNGKTSGRHPSSSGGSTGMHAWIGEPGLHDGEVRSFRTNRGGRCERARTGNAPLCDPILYSLDCGEKRHTPAILVCLDDDVVSRFEMYPEHTPSRRRIKQTARRALGELSDAEGLESLCNLSGIVSPEYVTFNSAYARPSPSDELILNNRLHRLHESIMAVACCVVPNILRPSGWGATRHFGYSSGRDSALNDHKSPAAHHVLD